ncbi:hypothetical protein KUTeg_020322 [Tegillarca granosa]|uniref:Uncharacterized protein n=1 Tax=Tegillarca granosa TaxID=220873 RepID=A0ABQ9ED01_TEGGR|nr:hypothetical protein KUTeg_020322 [Tegillarca granosa]
MEAAMEKQLSDFDIEREQLRNKLAKEEAKNKELQLQIDSLQMQSDTLQRQLTMDKSLTGDPYHSVEVKPLVSGGGAMIGRSMSRDYQSGVASHGSDSPISVKPVPKTTKPIITEGSIRVNESPDRHQTAYRSTVRPENVVQKTVRYGSSSPAPSPDRMGGSADNFARIGSPELRIAPVGAVSADKASSEGYRPSARIGVSPGSTAVVSSGGKVLTVSVGHSGGSSTGSGVNLSPRKVLPAAGRGTPPPLPPNKPVFTPSPVSKPAPPPKVGITVAKERGGAGISGNSSPKPVHIPVSVVHSTSSGTVIGRSSAAGSDSSTSSSSPIRKPTQVCVNAK